MSIKKKLYLLILIIMLPMITLQVFKIVKSYNDSVNHALNSNKDFAEAVSVSFKNYLERLNYQWVYLLYQIQK